VTVQGPADDVVDQRQHCVSRYPGPAGRPRTRPSPRPSRVRSWASWASGFVPPRVVRPWHLSGRRPPTRARTTENRTTKEISRSSPNLCCRAAAEKVTDRQDRIWTASEEHQEGARRWHGTQKTRREPTATPPTLVVTSRSRPRDGRHRADRLRRVDTVRNGQLAHDGPPGHGRASGRVPKHVALPTTASASPSPSASSSPKATASKKSTPDRPPRRTNRHRTNPRRHPAANA